MTPEEKRFSEFKEDLNALDWRTDIKKVTNIAFFGWVADYGSYVKKGGDRPTKKPPTA